MTRIPACLRGCQPLTPAVQYAALRSSNTFRGDGVLSRGQIVWRYEVTPTPLSCSYDLELRYGPDTSRRPNVLVRQPDLSALAEGRELPHVFSQSPVELCLYLPRTGEWSPERLLDATILPWSQLWFFYFEDWLVTDNWKGGGVHPKPSEES